MAKGPFRDSRAPFWLSVHQTDVLTTPPIGPAYGRLHVTRKGVSSNIPIPRRISKGKKLRFLNLFRLMLTFFDGIRYLYSILE